MIAPNRDVVSVFPTEPGNDYFRLRNLAVGFHEGFSRSCRGPPGGPPKIFPWASKRATICLAVGLFSGLNRLGPRACLLPLCRCIALFGPLDLVGFPIQSASTPLAQPGRRFLLMIMGIRQMPLDWALAQLGFRGARGSRGPHTLCYAIMLPGLLKGPVSVF